LNPEHFRWKYQEEPIELWTTNSWFLPFFFQLFKIVHSNKFALRKCCNLWFL